jgi:hypothetical protein
MPVCATPGPVVRGPDGFDVVFENDLPVVVTYAEAGMYALHQEAAARDRLILAFSTANSKLPTVF